MLLVGTDSSDDNIIANPQWEASTDGPSAPEPAVPEPSFIKLIIVALLVIASGTALATRNTNENPASPPTSTTPTTTSIAPATTSTLPSAPGTRAFAQFDGPVLGVEVGASVVSTDFDGRLFALDLDSGILTRSQIRTGNFVTVAGRLVVQTGCGGWQAIELPSFVPSDDLIECSSYLPLGQRGAETSVFAHADADRGALVEDGQGGLAFVELIDDQPSSVAAVSGGRLLLDRGDELVWVDPLTNQVDPYADGHLLAASPGGVLWSNSCELDASCRVWFGSQDVAQLRQFVVKPFDLGSPTRLNRDGSRAVFFKPDDILRIVTTETGHARELSNPGISPASSTWSPDGLWLLETSGANVLALNTLNGRYLEFEGIPGDFSPGWIALPITN